MTSRFQNVANSMISHPWCEEGEDPSITYNCREGRRPKKEKNESTVAWLNVCMPGDVYLLLLLSAFIYFYSKVQILHFYAVLPRDSSIYLKNGLSLFSIDCHHYQYD